MAALAACRAMLVHTIHLSVVLIATAVAIFCGGVTTLAACAFVLVGAGVGVFHIVGNRYALIAAKRAFLIVARGA